MKFSSHAYRVAVTNNFLVFVAAGTWRRVCVELLTTTCSEAVLGATKLAFVDVGTWTWIVVQLFEHGSFTSSQLVLSSFVLYI